MNKLFSFCLFLFFGSLLMAQNGTTSAYSFYGLGEPNQNTFSNYKAMGSAQTAISDPEYINQVNPAAIAGLRIPTLAAGFNFNWLKANSSTSGTQSTSSQSINGIAFGFPMGKRFGAAFGISPFTKMGYELFENRVDPILGNYKLEFIGTGGIDRAQGGIGGMPIKDSANTLMLGVQASYYFGYIQTERSITGFTDNTLVTNSRMINRINANDVAFDFGFIYRRKLKSNTWLALGANYQPTSELFSEAQELSFSYTSNSGVEKIVDTVQSNPLTGNVILPSKWGVGLALHLDKNWTIAVDYKVNNWSELDLLGQKPGLSNSERYSFGVQHLPDAQIVAKFLPSIKYRFGGYYENSHLNINGTQLQTIAGTAGIGIPVSKTKMKSTFNFGIEFGTRSSSNSKLINENFTNLFIGLSFNPYKFDTWFKKSKYD